MRIALNTTRRLFTFQTPCTLFKPSLLPTIRTLKFNTTSSLRCKTLGFNRRHRAMSTVVSPPSVHVTDRIDLTDKEKLIFDRLLQVLQHFNLQTQLRVAGGWVRDKLLGKECFDIDIALDNMLGREFCEKVNEYLTCKGEETQGIGVIQCNPDQSKHLETARMRLFDVWIDFVNLRSEDYSENSRIPTMRFGTPEEDAYRRDLTINSLFYNINTSSVEDFTGRGIGDLKSGKVVTPLPPKETFLDDPLRVLRAIRFGSRFDFILDEELKKAAVADDVRAAITDKISRERIGHEIDLMVSGNQPVKAMTYVSDLLLFPVVFSLPPNFVPQSSEECDSYEKWAGWTQNGLDQHSTRSQAGRARLCVAYMNAMWSLMQLIGCSTFSDEERRLSLYAALFLPFKKSFYNDNKSKKIPVVSYIFRNSLKLKSSDAETVIGIHSAIDKFLSFIPFIVSDDETKLAGIDGGRETLDVPIALKLRVFAGLLLREIKEFWRVALLVSTLLYPTSIACPTDSSDEHSELDKRKKLFKTVENAILQQGLEKVWEVKPLVNGKEIMSVLQLKTGGPLVREWQRKLLEWQLAYPSGTAEECLDWMRETHSKRARVE